MKKIASALFLCCQTALLFGQGLVPVYYTAQKLYGYHNYRNEQVIAPKYQEAMPLAYGKGCFIKTAKGYGALNAQGQEVVAPQYESFESIGPNGYFIFSKAEQRFVHNSEGKLILQGPYYFIMPQDIEGSFAVSNKEGKQNLASAKKPASTYPYLSILATNYGYFIAQRSDQKWGFLLPDGTEKDFEYTDFSLAYQRKMDEFSIAGPMILSKNILFDPKTQAKLKLPYESARLIAQEGADGFLEVSQNGKKGMVDLQGKVLVPCTYQAIYWCGENRTFLAIEAGDYLTRQKQFFSPEGKALGTGFREAECFQNGLAPVQNKAGQYGYLNGKGEMVLPFQYQEALPPLQTTDQIVLAVKELNPSNKEKPWLLLELQAEGKTKTLGSYEELSSIVNGQAYKNYNKSSKKYQIVFAPGYASPQIYDQIDSRSAAWIMVKEGQKQGAFGPNGHSLLASEYDPYLFWSPKGAEHLIIAQNATTKKKGVFDIQKKQWLAAAENERIDHLFFADNAIIVRKDKDGPIEQIIIPQRGLIFAKQ